MLTASLCRCTDEARTLCQSSQSDYRISWCDQSVVDKVIAGEDNLLASKNDYDWLGNGIYFWENNEERALEWAVEMSKRKNSTIKSPAVIGAVRPFV